MYLQSAPEKSGYTVVCIYLTLPAQKLQRYIELGLSEYDASVLTNQLEMALFFDKVVQENINPKTASNFIMGEIAAFLKEEKITIENSKLNPENFVNLMKLLEKGTISNNIAKSLVRTYIFLP